MRTSLAPYLNQFVLCKGWISFWEEIPEYSTRRVVVSQTTIKKADKHLLFEKQKVISTEHHLNLFIKYEDLPNYEIIFELQGIINFTGIVERYTRKDGSEDYGIYANKQSTIPFEIQQLRKGTDDAYKTFNDFGKGLEYLKTYAIPKADELMVRLEECGDMLPTFTNTYADYFLHLSHLQEAIPKHIRYYNGIISSREYRRRNRKSKSSLHLISQMKETKTTNKSNNAIEQLKNNLTKGMNNE